MLPQGGGIWKNTCNAVSEWGYMLKHLSQRLSICEITCNAVSG